MNTRKQRGLSTYVLFIDFSKAFDREDHNMLWWKLEKIGVSQKFISVMCALKSIYCNVQRSVRLNGVLSDWFTVRMGLKQDGLLSLLLFTIYINDLAEEIKAMNIGVNIDDDIIAILIFADDIALITENEGDLQKMMDKLNSWCEKWKMVINDKKTQVMNFQPSCINCTEHIFTCGRAQI